MSDHYLSPRAARLGLRRRDQPHLATELADISAPMMRVGAGFHHDKARGLGGKNGQCLIPSQRLAEHQSVFARSCPRPLAPAAPS